MGVADEPKLKPVVNIAGSEHQPTREELEESVTAIFTDDWPSVESGKGEQTEKEREAWLKCFGA